MKSGGISSHLIDYQDHLGGGLNNLDLKKIYGNGIL